LSNPRATLVLDVLAWIANRLHKVPRRHLRHVALSSIPGVFQRPSPPALPGPPPPDFMAFLPVSFPVLVHLYGPFRAPVHSIS
jgi:hypothetical protein